ncbi:hypothetical protein KKE26_09170 [bacterium]|nr:hypothetical protein [bacterium]
MSIIIIKAGTSPAAIKAGTSPAATAFAEICSCDPCGRRLHSVFCMPE